MKINLILLVFLLFGLYCCSNNRVKEAKTGPQTDGILKIEMNLSAFGVESDSFPSITAKIDFIHDTSFCVKTFYSSTYKSSTYSLTKSQMDSIRTLLKIADLEKLKSDYKVTKSDQPRSTTKIYTTGKTFIVDDYGLEGGYPLQQLYKIVYRY
jgi:hypothetical protein